MLQSLVKTHLLLRTGQVTESSWWTSFTMIPLFLKPDVEKRDLVNKSLLDVQQFCFFWNFCFIRFVNNCVWCRAKASVHLWASTVLQFVGDCHWVHHHCDNKHGVKSLLSLSLSLNRWSALQVVVCKFLRSLVVSRVISFTNIVSSDVH